MINPQFLDHVALNVTDLQRSADWYQKVLNLRQIQPEDWKPAPIYLLAGQTGIALFPAEKEHPSLPGENQGVRIDHLAFRIPLEQFQAAQDRLAELGIEATVKDHRYFRSIYFLDPDGHQLELTALVVDPEEFFGVE